MVGAPCGVMDQMTAVFGEEDRLLALLCQPAEIRGNVEIPSELSFWGIDSGIAHQVSGADYASVRVGAFMGYRMLKEWCRDRLGRLPREPDPLGAGGGVPRSTSGDDPRTRVSRALRHNGRRRHHGRPGRVYPVRRPTAHPVYEHARVQSVRCGFSRATPATTVPRSGRLMYRSHASYSACGLGSEGTDRLVELARGLGPSRGIYGAKITGGGSGGTVAILGRRDAGRRRFERSRTVRRGDRSPAVRLQRLVAGSAEGIHTPLSPGPRFAQLK